MNLRFFLPVTMALVVSLAACADQAVAPASGDAGSGAAGSDPFDPSASLTLASSQPADIVVGEPTVLRGTGFAPVLAENVVTLDGVPLAVTAVTGTALTVAAPASGFACAPARTATLRVVVRGTG